MRSDAKALLEVCALKGRTTQSCMPETGRDGDPLEFCEECVSPLEDGYLPQLRSWVLGFGWTGWRGTSGEGRALEGARKAGRRSGPRFLRPLHAAGGRHGPPQEADRPSRGAVQRLPRAKVKSEGQRRAARRQGRATSSAPQRQPLLLSQKSSSCAAGILPRSARPSGSCIQR